MLDSVMELTANVEDVTAQLADMLGIDQQELTELFQQLSGQETAQAEDISFAGQALEEPVQTMQDEGSGVPVIVEETVQEPQRSREETTGETVKDVQAEPQQTAESSTDAVTVQAQETGTEKKQTSQDKEEKGQNLSQQPQTFSQNTVQTQNVVQEASVERFDMERTQDIIDQIADYVKIHNSEQVSSMEIQLNPANLGTVNLQVVSKEGTISAQLTAQDEAVRAALESQVTQLKEALEAQGLKIDAVEVTVASHAFEQNLEQQDRQEEEAEKSSARKSGRRLLDLDELSGDGEDVLDEMSDADRLQAEMMRMGGNRLNYQV
jgi:flagellar hook-length control protein FliK